MAEQSTYTELRNQLVKLRAEELQLRAQMVTDPLLRERLRAESRLATLRISAVPFPESEAEAKMPIKPGEGVHG